MSIKERILAVGGLIIAVAVASVVGWALFIAFPDSALELVGVLLTIGLALAALKTAGRVIRNALDSFNVAEVSVEGPISRDGGSPSPLAGGMGTPADKIVDQIERATDNPDADALVVQLNTPGGEVLPSEDIRAAVERFEGPTVAYATDTCASGGYWIAAGCDELWARKASVIGSIGVVGSRPNASELAARLGINYEQFTAGEFKDAGTPLKEVSDTEREYLQGLVDDYYDQFVTQVSEGRDMDPEAIRETEARVFLGEEAQQQGLVDQIGTRDDLDEYLSDQLGTDPEIRQFEPERGLSERLSLGVSRLAAAVGAGIVSAVVSDRFQFR